MDKYEYKLKTEEMLELMEDGEYRKAAAAADLIDWKRVRNAGTGEEFVIQRCWRMSVIFMKKQKSIRRAMM